MPRTSDKRERLVKAAKQLIHEQGSAQTTLADIARESKVPLGNVYYYFKTKDDIVNAVIEERMDEFCGVLRRCDCERDPRCQLIALTKTISRMADVLAEKGCPIGSLVLELGKCPSSLSDRADAIVKRQIEWAAERFEQLGASEPRKRALHLVGAIQGACLTGHVLKDPKVVRQQMTELEDWINTV